MILKTLRTELPPAEYAQKRAALEASADCWLTPRAGPVEKVAARLRKRRLHWFAFLAHPAVEATNNRAERALWSAVIARKSSCGNKTSGGKHTWGILASLAGTCTQRGQDLLEYLRPQLTLAPMPGAAKHVLEQACQSSRRAIRRRLLNALSFNMAARKQPCHLAASLEPRASARAA